MMQIRFTHEGVMYESRPAGYRNKGTCVDCDCPRECDLNDWMDFCTAGNQVADVPFNFKYTDKQ